MALAHALAERLAIAMMGGVPLDTRRDASFVLPVLAEAFTNLFAAPAS